MKIVNYIVIFIIIYTTLDSSWAQQTDIRSTIKKDPSADTLTLLPQNDQLKKGQIDTIVPKNDYKISPDAISEPFDYSAKDSSWNDIKRKKTHLYGTASVSTGQIKIDADSIIINYETNILEGYRNQKNTTTNLPTFTSDANSFTFDSLRYNFKTRKGIVFHARTEEGEFTINGEKTKFISNPVDSIRENNETYIYNEDAIITTCNHYPPHFGIRASKMKFVPKKLAVLSVAQLEIEKVPLPIFLPFGFFPLIKGKSSGLIFPNNYEYNEQLGLGFRGVGYYWPLGQKADLTILGDIYTRGSWGISLGSNYKKRYGYNGNVTVGYRRDVQDNEETGKKQFSTAFSLRLRHAQDPKAHPYINMSGDINFTTNRYDQRNSVSANRQLENTIGSNFTFTHKMPGTPFNFTAEFRHSQNLLTRKMDITLPNITLRMNTIFPFKSKNSNKERWTDNIAFGYSSELRNFVKVVDTTLFTSATIENLQTGISNNLNLNTNIRLLKYFNLTPFITHREVWLTKRYKENYFEGKTDLTRDSLVTSFDYRPGAFRDFRTGVNLTTQLFGTINSKRGFFRGIRHIVKPTIGFNYIPKTLERYQEIVDTDTRPGFISNKTYSIYTNSPFGTLTGSEEQLGISYGVSNIIEAKYWSKRDSTEKKIRLFDNIGISGFYNFVNDSLPWSLVNVSGNTTVLKGLTNFNFGASFSPYEYDFKNKKPTRELVWKNSYVPLSFLALNGQFTTSISFGKIREFIIGKTDNKDQNPATPNNTQGSDKLTEIENPKESKWTSLAAWFENFAFSHSYNFDLLRNERGDTFRVSSHSISINGSIPLSQNWNLNIGNIAYDIKNNRLPYPYFTISRDLHCWQMNFSWAPDIGTYSFFIGVKSSALNFIKYDYGQRSASSIFSGRSR